MDPRYMRIEDDSDSSFSCGPTPPNPNNDNDTSCILRLSPETLQRDSLPDTGAPWQPPGPTSSGGLRNLVYDEAYSPPPALLPTVLEKPPVSLDDVINNARLPENLESVPALDLTGPRDQPLSTCDVIGDITADATAGPRPDSCASKESSSEGSAEENLNLLGPPLTEAQGEEQLLPPGSGQALDGDVALRKPSFHEMEPEYDCLPDWNWPLLRRSLVGVSAAVWLALLAVCVGWLVAMPRKCDPFRKWYQGETLYELFPGSFQDSDGDGVGDLRGLQSRLYYISGLGASTIVLTGLLKSVDYPRDADQVVDFTMVEPLLGSEEDLVSVIADAHAMKLHVILALNPVPLLNETVPDSFGLNLTQSQQRAEYPALQHVLEHWLLRGMDGFLLRGLEQTIEDAAWDVNVEKLVREARNLLDRYTQGMEDRVLVAPLSLAQTLAEHGGHNASDVLRGLDLLDCQLEVEDRSPKQIADQITEALSWDESADAPWLTWRLATGADQRLAGRLGRPHTVGATLLQALLPGTVTLLYGDEVGLMDAETEAEAPTNQSLPGLGIMPWSDAAVSADFTLSAGQPWRPLPADHHLYNTVSQQNVSVQAVRHALQVHRSAVPVYVNGIFSSIGHFHPTRSSNLQVRHVDDSVIVLDRFYPRQPRWGVVYNTADVQVKRDLSHIFFRGMVKASSTGDKQGYIRFQELQLEAGEGVLFELDR